jgi:hypothetical protein
VCKALDENFRRVDCTLWPKKLGQAPSSGDLVPPTFPPEGDGLRAEHKEGRVLLRWRAASDNEAVYGYQVFRGDETTGGALVHHASVRALSTRYEDARIVGGGVYRYALRAYDLGGNRGPLTAVVEIRVPS